MPGGLILLRRSCRRAPNAPNAAALISAKNLISWMYGSTAVLPMQQSAKPVPNWHGLPDMYLEGSDQHRGWFQSSLLTSVATEGKAPYRAVLTHGYVVDGEGRENV